MVMKPLAFDVETTTFAKGNPFSQRNKLVLAGTYDGVKHEYYSEMDIKDFHCSSDTLVLTFNGKFDLNWLRRYGVDTRKLNVWDTQLAYYILTGQKNAYPSLNEVSEYYGLGSKIDQIKEKYWEQGIDTTEIPIEELTEYLAQDLNLTYKIYEKQKEDFKADKNLYYLFRLQCRDLVALHEMEVNGLKFDYESAKDMELKLMKRINELETLIKFQYNLHVKDISWSDFNFNSHDHIKVLLHGGKRIEEKRIPNGLFKSGFKEGQVRYRIEKVEHQYLTMLDPELQRGKISVDVKVLKNYAPKEPVVKQILDAIIERSKLNKILGTYLKGLIDLREEKDWRDGLLHPNYNQCVVKTGRLSSSSPNGQNLAGDILNLIVSRYDD